MLRISWIILGRETNPWCASSFPALLYPLLSLALSLLLSIVYLCPLLTASVHC
jgi:hypothetical protein